MSRTEQCDPKFLLLFRSAALSRKESTFTWHPLD